jgi:simple sugar transport system ATP-binding protein
MANKTPAAAPASAVPLLELRGLSKAFGDCIATSDISFSVARGSIHALVGENGAGKSTAMKMLYGIYPPDTGEILMDGVRKRWRSPRDAKAAGIGMVHQHFMLAEPQSALDNVVLGDEPVSPRWKFLPAFMQPIDRGKARTDLNALAAANHFQVDFDQSAGNLPVGVQQRLEILKLLYRDAGILILDEPTAVLTPREVDELFANLRKLRDSGKTIIIITHKLREVLALCDTITVIRKGETVKTLPAASTNEQELADLMVGRAVTLKVEVPPLDVKAGKPGLELAGVTLSVKRGRARLSDLSLQVAPGEIVGIAGVEGNGQSDLLQLLIEPKRFFAGSAGMRAAGTLSMLGTDVRFFSAADVRRLGVGIVPEDRHREGLLLQASVAWNYLLGHQRSPGRSQAGVIRWQDNRQATEAAIREFDIRPQDPDVLMSGLSGGNQQKVVIAREFRRDPSLFVFAQPTRGVDVGSIEFIHARIVAARTAGHAVLLISSSLEEIIALSDRILVMYEGRINGAFQRGGCSEGDIGRLMGGAQ